MAVGLYASILITVTLNRELFPRGQRGTPVNFHTLHWIALSRNFNSATLHLVTHDIDEE